MTNIYSIITEQGFSNLTAAIEEGQPIDWERLDELTAKCVNRELNGSLTYMMERNHEAPIDTWVGWTIWLLGENLWTEMFAFSWEGNGGWTLWGEGDIPLTTDSL